MDEQRSLFTKMEFRGLLVVICLCFTATSAGAQWADSIVNDTKHVLDTRKEFEDWCEKGLKGVVLRKYVKDVATTSCHAVSNLKTGGKGVVYGCLVEDEAFESGRR